MISRLQLLIDRFAKGKNTQFAHIVETSEARIHDVGKLRVLALGKTVYQKL